MRGVEMSALNEMTDTDPLRRLLSRSAVPGGILRVLDSLRCGGFLLDLRGHVLSLNMIAMSFLGDGLVLGGERLSAVDRKADLRLRHLVGSVVGPGHDPAAPLSVAVPRHCRLPLVVRIIRVEEDVAWSAIPASLLLLGLDPELWRKPPREVLTQTFGLTAVEAEVAIGIACGRTLAEIAVERGVRVGTVRAHSKAVFSKTHTRGQVELAGTLTRLAFLVPQSEPGTGLAALDD